MKLTVGVDKIVEIVAGSVAVAVVGTDGILVPVEMNNSIVRLIVVEVVCENLGVCSLWSTLKIFVRNIHRGAVEGLHFPDLKVDLDEFLAELAVD